MVIEVGKVECMEFLKLSDLLFCLFLNVSMTQLEGCNVKLFFLYRYYFFSCGQILMGFDVCVCN